MQFSRMPMRWQILTVIVTPILVIALMLIALNLFTSRSSGDSEGASTVPGAEQQPSLMETLQAADALAKAGKLPGQPSLMETLQAADALAKAGKLPGQPSLMETLQAADALAKAGKLPGQQPSLLEVLQAADALAKAGKLPGQEQAAAVPPAQSPPEQPPQATSGGWLDSAYSEQVRSIVNSRREEAGLPPLAEEPRLQQAAGSYARVLTEHNWFDHTGPDGSTLVERVEQAGFPFDVQVGEVLAWGTESWPAEGVVEAWLTSAAHREEILSGEYHRAGIGCYFTGAEGTTVHCVMDLAG